MPDYLSCGSCPVDFQLADINSFIEHKRQRCFNDNSADNSDQLECIKCSKRFHTPWPLLFHVQRDHQILVVRNLDSIQLPMVNGKRVSPVDDRSHDEPLPMDTEHCDSICHNNYRDMSTQTLKSSNIVYCKPIALPACCKKVEPQCFEEPCPCPSNGVFLSDLCYYSCDNVPKSDSESSATCCTCPQRSIKKESREVQTDFDYNDDVDINFLLSNHTDSSNDTFSNHISTTFPPPPVPFTSHQYANGYSLSMDKNWGYYSQPDSQMSEANNNTRNNYMHNYDNSNYQMILNDIRLQTPSNPDFLDPAHRLSVDPRTPSPSSQQNLNLALNSENHSFPFKPNSLKEPSLMNNPTLFQDSNNSFQFNMPAEISKSAIGNSALSNSQSMSKKIISRQPLISSNENCLINYFQNQTDLGVEFANTENVDSEKSDGEKKEFRFICPNCGKRFRQKVHLRKHVMSQHARQKPHKCSQCGYTTVEKSHLTVHIRTHTGERPYTCRRCSYSSAQNCTLKSHYLRRHPGDQIDCNLCGTFYITEQERNNHQRSCRIVNGMTATGHSNNSNNSDQMELPNSNTKTA